MDAVSTESEVLLGGLLLALSACWHGPSQASGPDESGTGTIEDNDAARGAVSASGAKQDANIDDPVKPTADSGLTQTGTQDGGPPRGTAVDTSKICDGSKSLRAGFEGSRNTGCGPDYPCPGLAVLTELGGSSEMAGQFEEWEETDSLERQFVVVHHKRKKYRCACGSCVETALGPDKLIAGGRYSMDFAVSVAIAKYAPGR